MDNLTGQVAIISGGLGDIGRAIARELAQRGADIAVGDVRPADDAADFLDELRRLDRRARYDIVDVADAAAVDEWVLAAEAEFGAPTLIIPNAAIVHLADIRTVTPAQWQKELRVNLDGAYHLAQAGAMRLLHHGKPGRIVFIGSWAGHAPQKHIPAYCASKAALRMLGRCMALDLAPNGILVNEVAPGNVDAGLSGRFYKENAELREKSLQQIPIHKLIEPEEVAFQVAHLCDPRNPQMTGSTIVMDGGLSLLSY
jgi:NAD(P)-dependent dehydrogenase (short-subunit alcohol dehydrogenase family)